MQPSVPIVDALLPSNVSVVECQGYACSVAHSNCEVAVNDSGTTIAGPVSFGPLTVNNNASSHDPLAINAANGFRACQVDSKGKICCGNICSDWSYARAWTVRAGSSSRTSCPSCMRVWKA